MPIASSPLSSFPIASSPGTNVVVWAGDFPDQESIFYLDQITVTYFTQQDLFGFQFSEEPITTASAFGATYLTLVSGLVIFTNVQPTVVLTATGSSGQIYLKKLYFSKYVEPVRTEVPAQPNEYALPISDNEFLIYLPPEVVTATPSVGTFASNVLTVTPPVPVEVTFTCTTLFGEVFFEKVYFPTDVEPVRTEVPAQPNRYALPISDNEFLVYLPPEVVTVIPSVGTFSSNVLTVTPPAPAEVIFTCTTSFGETLELPVKISVW